MVTLSLLLSNTMAAKKFYFLFLPISDLSFESVVWVLKLHRSL